MPTISESQRVNTSRLTPVSSPVTAPVIGGHVAAPAAPIATPVLGGSPFMTAALPIFASGTDRDGRQWFRPGLPQRRFLPIGIVSTL